MTYLITDFIFFLPSMKKTASFAPSKFYHFLCLPNKSAVMIMGHMGQLLILFRSEKHKTLDVFFNIAVHQHFQSLTVFNTHVIFNEA